VAWKNDKSESNHEVEPNSVTPDPHESDPRPYAYIRCAYLDRTRAPLPDDGERYWRCSALIPLIVRQTAHQQTMCPPHREASAREAPHTQAEVKAMIARYLLGVERRSAVLTREREPGDDDELTPDELAWAHARKEELRQQAIAAGLPMERVDRGD
jgi:hypothetical protein